MFKSIVAICTSSLALKFLVLASLLVSLIQTYVEWYELNEVFKLVGEYDIEPNTTPFRTSLAFTVVLFGAVLSCVSAKWSKIALVLMTITLVVYWSMLWANGYKIELPFGVNYRFRAARNLCVVSYQFAPLVALFAGYRVWLKRYNYRSIALAGFICVVFQLFIWFIDTRLIASEGWTGASYQYPPVTVNAIFYGASWGHVVLLIFCTITIFAIAISMNRDRRNQEFRHI